MMRSFKTSCLRMDPEYFERFQPDAVAHHIQLASRLTPDHPCEISCARQTRGDDQKSASSPTITSQNSPPSAVCSRPLDSISKKDEIYTFVEATPSPIAAPGGSFDGRPDLKGRPGLSRKKIVDVFLVHPIRPRRLSPPQHDALRQTVSEVVQLLDAGRFDEARQYVNRRLVERLDKQRSAFTGLLDTVQITFDNSQSPTDTIMDIQSDDTPAFLYALANASGHAQHIHYQRPRSNATAPSFMIVSLSGIATGRNCSTPPISSNYG